MKKKKKKKPDSEPITCASCNERNATGSLYITFDPYEEQRLKPEERYATNRIDRGFRLHLPICGECCKKSFKINLQLDIKSEQNTWGHLDPIAGK